jgi:hypothetical protein
MCLEKYVKQFKELHKQKTGRDLSDQEALENFQKLAEMVRHIYKQIPKEDFEPIDTS